MSSRLGPDWSVSMPVRPKAPPPKWPLAASRDSRTVPPSTLARILAPTLRQRLAAQSVARLESVPASVCAGGYFELSSLTKPYSASSVEAGICLFILEFVHRPYLCHSHSLDTEVKVKIWEEKGGEKNKVCIVSSMKASI